MCPCKPAFRALFLDVDGVLADVEAPLATAFDAAFNLVSTYHPRLDRSRFRATFDATLRSAAEAALRGVPDADAVRLRFEQTLRRLGFPDNVLARRLAQVYLEARTSAQTLYPDAAATLPSLARRVRLGAILNGPAEARREQIRVLGLGSVLDWTLISSEEGVAKPDPEVYERAAQQAEVAPAEAIYVSAIPNEVYGACVSGMAGIWMNRAGRRWPAELERPATVIASLEELSQLI